uniref:Uncharacterized protein n=1 Tax=Oryza brachyantha TaxID=4533 RepID=J3NDM2_ORYBR
MAPPASPVPRLDASAVDPATVAYLRDLVGALEGKCFHLACDGQFAGDVTDDLFRLRPEPNLLHGVPDVVASAVKALEEILRKGCAALAAYGRHMVRLKREHKEEALGDAMAELLSVDDVIVDNYDAFDATRAHLLATMRAKQHLINQIAAVITSPAGGGGGGDCLTAALAALTSLLPRLSQAHQREAELQIGMNRMILSFLRMFWHLQIAKARVEAIEAALAAAASLSGDWSYDVQLVRDATARFEESAQILRQYMA